jgi:hypothetical protein
MAYAFGCVYLAHAAETQTASIPVPSGAIDVTHRTFNGGHAFQTDFKLTAKFPANPALTHYSKLLDGSWKKCTWIKGWSHYLDGTRDPAVMIHEAGDIWLKPEAKRYIMLSVRYVSSDTCAGDRPENDQQKVVLVEYADVNTSDVRQELGLSCASN